MVIVKIEYAEKAVENSGTAIGMGQIILPPPLLPFPTVFPEWTFNCINWSLLVLFYLHFFSLNIITANPQ